MHVLRLGFVKTQAQRKIKKGTLGKVASAQEPLPHPLHVPGDSRLGFVKCK